MRPRVWFGERWITSIFDLFEENVRYFPALLPVCDDEDPRRGARRAATRPQLHELRLHNGTIYRWNRPVYDVVRGRPHLRVENRVLPAGPTVVDIVANAAFYYGLVRALAEERAPALVADVVPRGRGELPRRARATASTRSVYWPGVGEVPVTELVLRRLLPLAHEGLDALGRRRRPTRDRLLGIIERRCVDAAQRRLVAGRGLPPALRGRGLERGEALRRMTVRYREHMHANEPVHTWPLP